MFRTFQISFMILDVQNNLILLNFLLTKQGYKTRVFFFQQIVNFWSLSTQDKAVMVGTSSILITIHPFLIAEKVFHLASYSSKITKPCIFETAISFQPFVTFEEQHLGINSKTLRFPGGLCF